MVSKINSKEKIGVIISLYNDGKRPLIISKTLNIPRNTVYDAIKRYKELGSLEDRPRSGRPVTGATVANKEKIRKKISRNLQRSMKAMEKSMKISEDSVRKIATTMPGHRSYKISKCHF
jgi:transposase